MAGAVGVGAARARGESADTVSAEAAVAANVDLAGLTSALRDVLFRGRVRANAHAGKLFCR